MMVTVEGEDYMTFAEASGLKGRTLFFTYAVRNALLPQTTALGLSISQILSGALLVEVIFSYPGIGSVLYNAIRQFENQADISYRPERPDFSAIAESAQAFARQSLERKEEGSEGCLT